MILNVLLADVHGYCLPIKLDLGWVFGTSDFPSMNNIGCSIFS